MIDWNAALILVTLPGCYAGGVVMGLVYFATLRTTADLLVRGEHLVLGLALTFGRIFALGGALYVVVLVGGFALLAATAGILSARWGLLRKLQKVRA